MESYVTEDVQDPRLCTTFKQIFMGRRGIILTILLSMLPLNSLRSLLTSLDMQMACLDRYVHCPLLLDTFLEVLQAAIETEC